MAKGNKKAKTGIVKDQISGGFDDFGEVFDMLMEQAKTMGMQLLVESLKVDKAIVETYKKAWLFRVDEDAKQ